MQKKHARQYIIITPAPGDIVILKITREDRSATDNLRTYCRVVEQKHPNRYRLLSTSWWKLRRMNWLEKSPTVLLWRFHATAKLGVQDGAAV